MLGMFSFLGWGGGDGRTKDDVDDLFDCGEGVVSRDEAPDAVDADDVKDEDNAPVLVALCLT